MTNSAKFSLITACYDLETAIATLGVDGIFCRKHGECSPQFEEVEILWDEENADKVYRVVAEMWSSVGNSENELKLWQNGEDYAFAEVTGWALLHAFVNSPK